MLVGTVGFVLLIACANVANLVLARGAARQHEFIVCLAVGPSRGRLTRHLLTESTVLATIGSVVGTAVAVAAVQVVCSMGTTLPRPAFGLGFGIPRLDEVAIDPWSLCFRHPMALAGIVTGVIPAIYSTIAQPDGPLRSGQLSKAGRLC